MEEVIEVIVFEAEKQLTRLEIGRTEKTEVSVNKEHK